MLRVLVLPALLLAVAGCGGDGLKLVPVTGTITYEGKPLEGAEVSFVPDQSNPDFPAGFDTTGPEGNFKLTTRNRFGLVPGKYHVAVKKLTMGGDANTKAKLPEDVANDPSMALRTLEAAERARATQPGAARGKSLVQQIEGEFSAEVPPEGGVLDFDVKRGAAKTASR